MGVFFKNMKKKVVVRTIFGSLTSCSLATIFACVIHANSFNLHAVANTTWSHYTTRAPSYADFGIKEYWVECGGTYQFVTPQSGTIVEKGNNPDTSEFTIDDSRWNKTLVPYYFDQNDRTTVVDAKAYNASSNEDQTWWGLSNACLKVLDFNSLKYKQYDTKNFIEYFPRINFQYYQRVDMDITLNIWKANGGGVKLGFDESAFTSGVFLGASTDTGTISFVRNNNIIVATLTYGGSTVLNETISDPNVLWGCESIQLYVTGTTTGDFYMTITNFKATKEEHAKLNLGVWNGSYHFGDGQQLRDIAAQGTNIIIGVNPYWTTQSKFLHTLDVADSLGIKFIVDPRNYNSGTGTYDSWDGTKPYYAEHNAVLGLDIWDEPSTQQYGTIASMKAQFDAVMPADKLFFVNLLGSACALESLYGSSSGKTSSAQFYENNYASTYQSTVNPDLYSWDSYPLFTNGQIRKAYFCNFDIWSYLSKNNNIPLWYTLLASGHNSGDGLRYITPTAREIRWQMSVAMTYGISNIMDYVYATTDDTYECMATLSGGEIVSYSDMFYDMGTVNNEFHSWEELYLSYEWQGVSSVKSGLINYLFNDLRHTINLTNYGLKSVSSTADLLVGAFKDSSGNYAYMMTNSGKSTTYSSKYYANVDYSNTAGTITITFPSAITGVTIIKNGVSSYQTVNGKTLSLNIDAYGSAFIIPTN